MARYDKHPPLIEVSHSFWQYTEKEADYLIEFYRPQLIGKPMNSNNGMKISDIIKEIEGDNKHPFRIKCISRNHNTNYFVYLDKITQQLGLPYPLEALKAAGLH